jgi:hypothetical protein
MNFKRVFPTLTVVTAACALGAVPVASARASEVQKSTSENWSGYVAGSSAGSGSQTFKSVTGSWVQPSAKCSTAAGDTYAAFWVGLGGADGRTALEQDGTEVNCTSGGKATYYAWYELVPRAPVKVDLAVRPGDHMTATTTVNGDEVSETILNHTTGASFSKTLTMKDPDTSSSEWIAEAPSECQGSVGNCSPLTLSDFGKVDFTGAGATDSSGHTGSISDPEWDVAELTLGSDSSSVGAGADQGFGGGELYDQSGSGPSASPSNLADDGSAFSVSYHRSSDTSSESSSTGGYGSAGGGYGYGSTGGYGYGSTGGDGYGYGYGYGSTGGYGYGSTGAYGDSYGYYSVGGGYTIIYTY